MDPKQFIKRELADNLEFIKMTLSDFSDADMFVRPCPGANHAAWHIGHLCNSETSMTSWAGAKVVALPTDFGEMFNKKTAGVDEAKKFGGFATKAVLLGLFEKVRGATIAWFDALELGDLDKPSPEKVRSWAPTLAKMAIAQCGHVGMHVGQFQVIRRKLGKPIQF
jgi:hypothetical protein